MKRLLHILLVLGVLLLIFYFAATAFTRPAVKTKEYKDPNFKQVQGPPAENILAQEIKSVVGSNAAVSSKLDGRTVYINGQMTKHDPNKPHTHESMHKRVIYMPILIFRKFPHVDRVRCIISNKSRNYGLDVTRAAFENFVGLSANNPSNNWESNVMSMLVYDKVNRDNFMELYGLYTPEY
ncbi:MAG: hypothetical protein ACO1N9_03625 [Flavobacterium sp.]